MTGQYLRVSATHTDGEGSGKTAHAMAANAVTSMPVDTCMEFLAGGPMGPVTQIGAWASDCASEAKSGSYAGYHTLKLDRRKQVETKPDLLPRTSTWSGGKGSVEPREPELRDHCDPGGWDLHAVEATTFLAQTGDFTLSVRPQECLEDRGMLRAGGARNGVTPALALPVIGHPV